MGESYQKSLVVGDQQVLCYAQAGSCIKFERRRDARVRVNAAGTSTVVRGRYMSLKLQASSCCLSWTLTADELQRCMP
jgi:hypothetical protein